MVGRMGALPHSDAFGICRSVSVRTVQISKSTARGLCQLHPLPASLHQEVPRRSGYENVRYERAVSLKTRRRHCYLVKPAKQNLSGQEIQLYSRVAPEV